ncbi:MAG: TauD/TfdA family dioxygenase [Actinomycetota bacterium]
MSELSIRRVGSALGAEVTGIDLDQATEADVAAIRAAMLDHLVLFFPDQSLTLDGHVALGRKFGELEIHPHLPRPDDDHPEVVELKASHGGIADEWHSDVTFLPNPSVMSILHMVECPDVGGDTMWANQYLAYETLSAPIREMLDSLHVIHNASPHGKPEVMAMHPLVRIHPETGRRSLLANEHFSKRIVELNHTESHSLLEMLWDWSVREELCVRHSWTPGTVAMWDNRCTQHAVVADFQGERIIQRVTVLGDRPEGDPPRWEPHSVDQLSATTVHDKILHQYFRAHPDALADA